MIQKVRWDTVSGYNTYFHNEDTSEYLSLPSQIELESVKSEEILAEIYEAFECDN